MPIKHCLQKKVAGQIWPMGHSLQTLVLEGAPVGLGGFWK